MNNALAKIPGADLKVLTTVSAGPRVSDRFSGQEKQTGFSYSVIFTRRIAGACVLLSLLKHLPVFIRQADVVHLTATFSFSAP